MALESFSLRFVQPLKVNLSVDGSRNFGTPAYPGLDGRPPDATRVIPFPFVVIDDMSMDLALGEGDIGSSMQALIILRKPLDSLARNIMEDLENYILADPIVTGVVVETNQANSIGKAFISRHLRVQLRLAGMEGVWMVAKVL
ncbi:hypothetical protein V6N12_009973 [Hibiscus sabdariffa]|uniref:Uncharacterized protein n=1 Tax=Hibiscus sabdariffa TaxID=183260 RepID=A0ABR2ECB2_9ROSI